jgi:hypothetical protein
MRTILWLAELWVTFYTCLVGAGGILYGAQRLNLVVNPLVPRYHGRHWASEGRPSWGVERLVRLPPAEERLDPLVVPKVYRNLQPSRLEAAAAIRARQYARGTGVLAP